MGVCRRDLRFVRCTLDTHLSATPTCCRWSGINVHVDDTWFDNRSSRTTSADTQRTTSKMGVSAMSMNMSEQGELSVGDRIAEFRRLRKEKKGNTLFRIFLIGTVTLVSVPLYLSLPAFSFVLLLLACPFCALKHAHGLASPRSLHRRSFTPPPAFSRSHPPAPTHPLPQA